MAQGDGTTGSQQAVVFDMDGVLVESEHLWERMWAAFATARGQTWTREQTKQVQGMSAPEWSEFLAGFSVARESAAKTERLVVDEMIAALNAGEIEPLDGARRMVTDVAALAPVALASSAPRRLIDAVLRRHDLDGHFTATVSSAEVARGKPNPDVYLEAARKLGCDSERCLAVEDSSNGLRAARAAGMTVLALPSPGYPPADDALAMASVVAGDLPEVRDRLVELLGASLAG